MFSEGNCHICLGQEEPSEQTLCSRNSVEKFKGSFGPVHLMRKNWDCEDERRNWQEK